jgi:hypothetical protein
MDSSVVPKEVSFIDDIQHQTTMAIVETYATYMFIKDKFAEIISDTNKFSEIKPTPEQERLQEKFLQVYSLYVATSVGLKKVEKIDDTKSTIKIKTSQYKKMDFSFDKIGKEMNTQIKDSFINTLDFLQSNQNIKSSEDYAVLVRGVLEGLKEKINFERQDGMYKELQDLVSKESFNIHGVTFRGFDKAERKGYDVGNWPKLEMVIGMDAVKNKGVQIIKKLMTYDVETKENAIHPGEQKLNVVGDSGVGKGFCITALCRYAVERAEELGKPINIIMMSPDKFKTSYMNESANNLMNLFLELYDSKSINIGIMEEIDTAISSRSSAKKEGRGEEANVTGAFLRATSTTYMSTLGNWMLITDTNEQVDDPAMKTRLGEVIIARGAETPNDFIRMLRDVHLKEGTKLKYLTVKDDEWNEIGELCSKYQKEAKLSGRDIENMSRSLKAYANNFEISDEFLKMDLEKQKEYITKNLVYNAVDKNMIIDKVTTYMTSLKEANDREAKDRREKRIQEWKEMDEATAMYEPTRLVLFKQLASKYLPTTIYNSLMVYLPLAEQEKKKEEEKQ